MADTRLSTRISEVGLDALEEQSEPVGTITRATARTRMPDTRMSEVGLETLDEVELAPTASASQHTLQSSRSATPGDQAPEQDAKREAGTPHVPRERAAGARLEVLLVCCAGVEGCRHRSPVCCSSRPRA